MLRFNVTNFNLGSLLSLSILLGIVALPVQAQVPGEPPTEDLSDPNNLRPLSQSDSILSLQGGAKVNGRSSTSN